MTNQEFYQTMNERELGLGEILKTSAGIFFENLQTWLLFSLIVFLPSGMLLQYLLLRIPIEEIVAAYTSGDLARLQQIDWSPVWTYFAAMLGLNLFGILVSLAASIYTDHWLHDETPSISALFRETVQKWPKGMLIVLWQLLICFIIVLMAIFSIGFFLLPGLLCILAISVLYQYAVVTTAVHQYRGLAAYGYAWNICRRRIGKSIVLVLILMLINTVFSNILTSLTSSFGILADRPLIFCFVLGLTNVIANLTVFFLAFGTTLHLLNMEYLSNPRPRDTYEIKNPPEIPGSFDVH